jgi:hypothetical protein
MTSRAVAVLSLVAACERAPAPTTPTAASKSPGETATPSATASADAGATASTGSSPSPSPSPSASAVATASATASATLTKPIPKSGPCAPQKCSGHGMCDAVLPIGWLWNGVSCYRAHDSGCELRGPDCGKAAADEATCKATHKGC